MKEQKEVNLGPTFNAIRETQRERLKRVAALNRAMANSPDPSPFGYEYATLLFGVKQ